MNLSFYFFKPSPSRSKFSNFAPSNVLCLTDSILLFHSTSQSLRNQAFFCVILQVLPWISEKKKKKKFQKPTEILSIEWMALPNTFSFFQLIQIAQTPNTNPKAIKGKLVFLSLGFNLPETLALLSPILLLCFKSVFPFPWLICYF